MSKYTGLAKIGEEFWNKLTGKVLEEVVEEAKAVEYESPAYKRIQKIIRYLKDISSEVQEIQPYKTIYKSYQMDEIVYKFNTALGLRYLVFNDGNLGLCDTFTWEYFQGSTFASYGYLYNIVLNRTEKTINVYPTLDCKAPMTEAQIYDSILEIEGIIDKYNWKTKSDEHKANLEKFRGRFEDDLN